MGSISTFQLIPMKHDGDSKIQNFGATVHGMDLGNVSDDHLEKLKDAILRYQLVVIKSQKSLQPKKHWELLQRLDPTAPALTDEQFARLFHPHGDGITSVLKLGTFPDAGSIHLIGKGYQGDDHFGLKNLTLSEAFADAFYSKPLPEEDFNSGIARFQSWHLDGPTYKVNPPMFSTLRYCKLPKGAQEVEWADGSGLKKSVPAGRTAFVNSVQLYGLLTDDEKRMADHSWVEYMYYPYEWIRASRGNPNGLGIFSEGRETPESEMAALDKNRDPSWTRVLPMVWVNSLTGEKAFQVQLMVARRLYIRNGPDEKPKVIEDVKEVRDFCYNLQNRIIKPEYIYTGPEDEGDVLLWNNWGVIHSKIDYPIKFGSRSCHQGWIPASRAPVGPVPIPDLRQK